MHWVNLTEATTIKTLLLVVAVSATLLTTAQSRVVVSNNRNNQNNNISRDGGDDEEAFSLSSSSPAVNGPPTRDQGPPTRDQGPPLRDQGPPSRPGQGPADQYYDDVPTISSDYEDADDEYYGDMDMWPVLCPPNNFYDLEKNTCEVCSPCPENFHIVKACHRFQDNLCIPLSSFDNQLSSQYNNSKYRNRNNPHHKASNISDKSHPGKWKSVSLTLLIITSTLFVCLLTVSAVFFYVKRLARTSTLEKEIVCRNVNFYSPVPRMPIVKAVADV